MVLKGDSSLLNGRKPMFRPDWTNELSVTPCLIVRISRLGKEIAPRFAERYYDALALGADFTALDAWREAVESGASWTRAIAFDYSLAIGAWLEKAEDIQAAREQREWLMTVEEAIAEASRYMTIRQGDLIYIQSRETPHRVERDEILSYEINGAETLYCKIK